MALRSSISRLVQSLHFKMASGVIGTVLIISTIYLVWDYHFYRTQLLGELRQSAQSVSQVTLDSLLELAMVGRHPEMLQGAVERLAESSPQVRTIQIIDLFGTVRFSSNSREVGTRLALSSTGCVECHSEENGSSHRSSVFELEGEGILRHAAPIPNREGCHSCHDPEPPIVGVLLVDHSTSAAEAKLRSSLSEMIVKAGTTALAILLVLGLLLNRIVISRIKSLTGATRRIADREPEALDLFMVEGTDEIGQLARSFEEMTSRLKAYCGELEEKERIRVSLLQRLVHTQEEERKNISRELHDHFGQALSALLLEFQSGSAGDRGNPGLSDQARQGIEARIRRLIEDVHRLAWQMRPSILDDYGLEKAVERYVEETSQASGIPIDFQQLAPNGLSRLPRWLETALYRVVQEALANIVRHSEATRASVVLMRNRVGITLLVEDNGVGFDPRTVEPTSLRGLGLIGMRERVSQCGGTLDLESAPAKGTTVRVRLPVESGKVWQSA